MLKIQCFSVLAGMIGIICFCLAGRGAADHPTWITLELYNYTSGYDANCCCTCPFSLINQSTIAECNNAFTYMSSTVGGVAFLCTDHDGNFLNISAEDSTVQFSLFGQDPVSNFTCLSTDGKIKVNITQDIYLHMFESIRPTANPDEFLAAGSVMCDIINGALPQ